MAPTSASRHPRSVHVSKVSWTPRLFEKKTRLQSTAAGLARLALSFTKFPQKPGASALDSHCGAKLRSIHLIKDPPVCPKSQGAKRKIRPRMRSPAFHLRHQRPIGAVSQVSWTAVFLCFPSDEGHPERNSHWGRADRGIFSSLRLLFTLFNFALGN
jgi:hypothetical protein